MICIGNQKIGNIILVEPSNRTFLCYGHVKSLYAGDFLFMLMVICTYLMNGFVFFFSAAY